MPSRILYSLILCLGVVVLTAQSTWIGLSDEPVSFERFFSERQTDLDLPDGSKISPLKSWSDQIGMRHTRSQQVHEGIPVEGAILLVHGDDHGVNHSNGLIVRGKFPATSPSISRNMAFRLMRDYYASYELYFEDDGLEAWIKEIEGDPNATFKPRGKLVYADERYRNQAKHYRLYWKFEVYVKKPIDREWIYIDAQTGQVGFVQQGTTSGCAKHDHGHHAAMECDMLSGGPSLGRGITRYIGEVEIVTDSIADSLYILNDETRGQGVRTYNALEKTDPDEAVDFEDDDNYWNMVNADRDEAAIDAHHGAQMTYDYWWESFNWSSFDGNGSPMLCYVHWDVGWFNASWNGRFSRYGDGRGDPLTYIDIVAHEFAHGLTGTTSGLIYANESGALNESFSDIFGTAVEHFALGDDFQWFIGIPNDPFRSMARPGMFGDPDTYLGDNWFTGSSDNGGVHSNSGVQNFWYYLLVNGEEGTNDFGYEYEVDSLGWEKASAIAFRNLTTYLTPSSNYYDARLGSLQAAADLYGVCSPEVLAVSQAWAAVGLGTAEPTRDIQLMEVTKLESSCDLSENEEVGLRLRFNPSGCNYVLDSGSTITLGYRVNGENEINETLVLDRNLTEGEEIEYTFQKKADVSGSGAYSFDYWIYHEDDAYQSNDTIFDQTVLKPLTLDNNASVIFRNFTASRDSFFFREASEAEAALNVDGTHPRPGLIAVQMTGKEDRPRRLDIPENEEDNFTMNPEFVCATCFCLDLTDWNSFILSFDLRQTFSEFYKGFVGVDVPELVSSMRITVNGEQVGDQFHPETYIMDPWMRHEMDLSNFIGSQIELCFEGKHFIDRETDRDAGNATRGDNTYLDNIRFSGKDVVAARDLREMPLQITPNPAIDQVEIEWDIPDQRSDVLINILDVEGRSFREYRYAQNPGLFKEKMNVSDWPAGVYSVILTNKDFIGISRIVISK
ncbi:MAG: M4 family metallopeptidase [Saprospiraceae bacterium]|nr:M4 family metallopeptidase [Saprospiraceae bacterium]